MIPENSDTLYRHVKSEIAVAFGTMQAHGEVGVTTSQQLKYRTQERGRQCWYIELVRLVVGLVGLVSGSGLATVTITWVTNSSALKRNLKGGTVMKLNPQAVLRCMHIKQGQCEAD